MYDQNYDTRVKNKCIEIRKTAQKQLIELENKTQELTRNYLIKTKELDSKINNIAKNLFKSFNLDLKWVETLIIWNIQKYQSVLSWNVIF